MYVHALSKYMSIVGKFLVLHLLVTQLGLPMLSATLSNNVLVGLYNICMISDDI